MQLSLLVISFYWCRQAINVMVKANVWEWRTAPQQHTYSYTVLPLCVLGIQTCQFIICFLTSRRNRTELYREKKTKESRNCAGLSRWLKWWIKTDSLWTAQLILSWNETMCSENGCSLSVSLVWFFFSTSNTYQCHSQGHWWQLKVALRGRKAFQADSFQ